MTEDNRIAEIRELVARHRANVSKNATPDELDVLLGIDPNDPVQRYANLLVRLASILDSAPPAPRVFLRGDIVPGGVCTQTENGDEYRSKDDRVLISRGPHVEVFPMTREEWQAAVDRAASARAIPEPTEGQNP